MLILLFESCVQEIMRNAEHIFLATFFWCEKLNGSGRLEIKIIHNRFCFSVEFSVKTLHILNTLLNRSKFHCCMANRFQRLFLVKLVCHQDFIDTISVKSNKFHANNQFSRIAPTFFKKKNRET